ncbi:hypothetical protein CEXT_488691 [Caerostris extrusa]|uniref:Uncharacterized protein n=1 Tax=Caerostris extrusa TaxID=172846 RepID=A0AAV4NPJ6_CAEEX|nr:hypothetical protein CEXT_488691 [Caerostris extrusa]
MTPNKERGCQGDGLPYKARGEGVIKVQAELLAAAVVPSVLCHWSGWAVSLRVQSTEVVLRFYESTCTLAPATRSWLNFGAGRQRRLAKKSATWRCHRLGKQSGVVSDGVKWRSRDSRCL